MGTKARYGSGETPLTVFLKRGDLNVSPRPEHFVFIDGHEDFLMIVGNYKHDLIESAFLFREMREVAYDFFLPKKFDQTDFDSVCRCWTFNWPRIDCNPI